MASDEHKTKPSPRPDSGELAIKPYLDRTGSGRIGRLERFSHYVARQIGFEDLSECSQLCKLADDYLRKTGGIESSIFEFFADDSGAEQLYVKLIEELDKCILAYFGFNWTHTSLMITQVLGGSESDVKPKLKDFIIAATRKQRFERVIKDFKVTRVFSTLVEEMKAIGSVSQNDNNHKVTDVIAAVAHSERSPVLLLMGGGMGAGKSTVLKDILKEAFWSQAATNAVVVEADAFKETDVIYRALSSKGHHQDMLQTAELVHQSSTDAASSLLVTALNEGRDVIMDGTLSWIPFVEQTIAMTRNIHKHRYRMGVGYKVADDGTVTENYWEKVEDEDEQQNKTRKPYRIELVGVVCDPYLAVVRGIRRAIMVGRAVRVKSQLTSHRRFAAAFRGYCQLVDNARLYSSNAIGRPPQARWKDGKSRLLVDQEEIEILNILLNLNDEADSVYELHADRDRIHQPGSVWNDIVLSSSRPSIQLELKNAVHKYEVATA
ncbi:Calmodulin calcium-dependent NAD kinase-like protein [Drosera capensis]